MQLKKTFLQEENVELASEELKLKQQKESLESRRAQLASDKFELESEESQLTIRKVGICKQVEAKQNELASQGRSGRLNKTVGSEIVIQDNHNMAENNLAVSSLAEFQIGDDWELYSERLDQFFIANNVPDTRWVAVLITKIGAEAYRTLRDLCDSVKPSTKSFYELCSMLKEQFSPKISAFKERVEFYNLMQQNNESISEWFARIKNKAIHCEFGASLDERIKDEFVTGLLKGPILDKMCEQETTMSLKDIVDKARNKEATLKRSTITAIDPVHRIQTTYRHESSKKVQPYNENSSKGKRSTSQKNDNTSALTCKFCGKSRHNFSNCRYKSYKCNLCHKKGYLSRVCTIKQKSSSNHFLKDKEGSRLSEVISNMFLLSNVDKIVDPIMVQIEIEGKKLNVEIDTGASRSIIPESIYKKLFSDCKLESTPVRLRMYNGEIILPIGQVWVTLGNKHLKTRGCLVVVRNGSRPLLGRDLMKRLGFDISSLDYVDTSNPATQLIKEYSELFDGKLGKFKYEKVEIKLKGEMTPIFVKPRPVPFALKKKD